MENNKCSGYGLVDLLKDKGKISGIEIGCDMGTTTVHLLQTLPNIQLYGIKLTCMKWTTTLKSIV